MDEWKEAARVAVRRAPPERMFLQVHGANGKLADGREYTVGSTCGAGSASLVITVIDDPETVHTFVVSGEDVLRSLVASGALADPTSPRIGDRWVGEADDGSPVYRRVTAIEPPSGEPGQYEWRIALDGGDLNHVGWWHGQGWSECELDATAERDALRAQLAGAAALVAAWRRSFALLTARASEMRHCADALEAALEGKGGSDG